MALYKVLKTRKIDVAAFSYVAEKKNDSGNKVYPQERLGGNNLNRNYDRLEMTEVAGEGLI